MTTIRERLLGHTKSRIEQYDLPLSGTVWMRSISELEFCQNEVLSIDARGGVDRDGAMRTRAHLLVHTLCDETGERIFTDSDLDSLMKLDYAVAQELYRTARAHCGMDRETRELTVKNLSETNGASSPTSSPESEELMSTS